MDRTEFVIVTTLILFGAFLMGWLASWLFHRVARVTENEMGELDQMAHALHEAEETRDQALAYVHEREHELTSQLSQTEAELRAAMDGLRDARHEAEELRAYIERIHAQ
ncbi:hypothetical protein [Rhodovulum adriaticum]|uniref:Uncharacterized protein n=1 Tax=Rhodovulum adriaticum TaxID=35804 RepID=A0A4V2SKZ9_RHOAD|nr:hypothetical protein [Rhodovulum adriaticum]MBK1636638.1 hypothetical protein [Rhodovulum adriaticum]TCP21376.1 hypothetical protein EV656_11127 [Rhodovulum adriaticum]